MEQRDMDKQELISRMDRVIHWVEVCDTKTSIILAVQAAVFTIIGSTEFVHKAMMQIIYDTFFWDGEKEFCLSGFLVIIFFLALILCCTISMYHLFKVLIAKTKSGQHGEEKHREEDIRDRDSMIHFECIANKETFPQYSDFKNRILEEKENNTINDIVSQIYINSERCSEKFSEYNKGLCWLKMVLVVLVLFLITVLFYQSSNLA